MARTAERTARFWNRKADGYAKKPVADESAYRRKLEITQSYLRPDMDVLEIGCGTGTTAIAHAPHVRRIEAVDVSERMLEIGREKARAAGVENVGFRRADIEATPPPPAAYDAVLALSILHLLEDRRATLAHIFDALKPGGLLVTSTVCLGDMGALSLIGHLSPLGRALDLIPLVRVFTADALAESLTEAGFAIEERWQPAKNAAVFIVARKPA